MLTNEFIATEKKTERGMQAQQSKDMITSVVGFREMLHQKTDPKDDDDLPPMLRGMRLIITHSRSANTLLHTLASEFASSSYWVLPAVRSFFQVTCLVPRTPIPHKKIYQVWKQFRNSKVREVDRKTYQKYLNAQRQIEGGDPDGYIGEELGRTCCTYQDIIGRRFVFKPEYKCGENVVLEVAFVD